jgi:hypothetical protein
MDKTLAGHLKAIQSGEVTKSTVIGLRKAINHAERLSAGWSGNRCNADPADVWEVEGWLERANPTVTGELHDSGLKLLRDKRYVKRLADYMDLIEWPKRFELVRFDRIGGRGMYAVPVYRLVGDNGGTMTFRNIPWQSGGNGPEVLSSGVMAR